MARVLLMCRTVGFRYRIRGVANVLLALILLGAMPASTWAEELQSPCTAKQHQCDAPSIARCCCVESGSGPVPATTESGPKLLGAAPVLAPTAAPACGLVFAFPPDAWFRVCSSSARPPLPLHLLNVSILR